jgi:putative NADH-flavin reductase
MNLLILGATGRVGQAATAQAITDGHSVTVLVRSPDKLGTLGVAPTTVVQGDACREEDVVRALHGADAVLSALGTDGGTVLTDSLRILIDLMSRRPGPQRIVTIGTAGILDSKGYPGLLRYESPESRRSSVWAAEEHRRAWELLSRSPLDWTIVCPTYLPLGERTGVYRVEADTLPDGGASISVADTADFACRQLLSVDYIRKRVGIAY